MKIKTFNGFVKIKSLDDPRVSAHLFVNSSPENTCVTHVVEKPLLLVNPDKMDLDTCLQAPGTGLTNQTKQKNNLQTTTEISKGTPVAMEGPPVKVSV